MGRAFGADLPQRPCTSAATLQWTGCDTCNQKTGIARDFGTSMRPTTSN